VGARELIAEILATDLGDREPLLARHRLGSAATPAIARCAGWAPKRSVCERLADLLPEESRRLIKSAIHDRYTGSILIELEFVTIH
jgi:hypothetical protein